MRNIKGRAGGWQGKKLFDGGGVGGVRWADTEDERSTRGEEKTENKSFDGVDLTSFLVEDRKFCVDTAIDPPAQDGQNVKWEWTTWKVGVDRRTYRGPVEVQGEEPRQIPAFPPWLLQAAHTPGKRAFFLHPSSSISLASPACSGLCESLREGDTLRNGMSMQRAALALGTLSGTDAPVPASAR